MIIQQEQAARGSMHGGHGKGSSNTEICYNRAQAEIKDVTIHLALAKWEDY